MVGRWESRQRRRTGGLASLLVVLCTGGCGEVNQSAPDAATDGMGSSDAPAPCRSRVVYAAGENDTASLYTSEPDGTDVRPVTSDPAGDREPGWSPDGATILFASSRDDLPDLYSIAPSGVGIRRLTVDGAYESAPSWSPDGRKIAYLVGGNLWVASSDGTLAAPLDAPSVPLFGSYRWSPDGQTLALASGTPGDLFVVPVSGGIATNITNTPDVDESHLAWSADATRIAFTRRSNGGLPDVWVAASDGSGAVNLTPNSLTSSDLWPLWTADGQIVFSSTREGGGQKLFRVSASGGLPTRVSDHRIPASSDDGDLAMAVSPDQERVLFTRFTETGAQQQVGVVRLDGTEQVTFGDLAKSSSWSPCIQ